MLYAPLNISISMKLFANGCMRCRDSGMYAQACSEVRLRGQVAAENFKNIIRPFYLQVQPTYINACMASGVMCRHIAQYGCNFRSII